MSKRYVIGVDLGGTKILTALAGLDGTILHRVLVDTGAHDPAEVVVGRMAATVEQVILESGIDREEVKRIGIGSPGTLNIAKGMVLQSPNLDWWDVPVVEMMEKELHIPVRLENDANAAALAEHAFGAGKGASNMVYMTISTGIGGGIIIDNTLLHGSCDSGGEIGHHTIDPNGPQCGCGNYGCLEAMASGTALGRYGREAVESGVETLMRTMVQGPRDVNGAVVAKAAEAGDPVALEIVHRVATYLGIGIANLINILNPERVVLGGGVTRSGHLFYDTICQTVEERAMVAQRKCCQIVFAALGSDVGVCGAIAVALKE